MAARWSRRIESFRSWCAIQKTRSQRSSRLWDLARETDVILSLAAAIVECVEAESVLSVLGRAESLGMRHGSFLRAVEGDLGVLDTVTSEAKLLEGLSELTREQRAIARETQTLSVLTNIEVARLGELGMDSNTWRTNWTTSLSRWRRYKRARQPHGGAQTRD